MGTPDKHLMDEWNKRLANEGMPEELEKDSQTEESEALKKIKEELRMHYIERGEADFGEHLKKMEAIKARAQHDGVSVEEVNTLTEEFLKSIEDEIANIQTTGAHLIADSVLKNERVLFRPKALEQEVFRSLRAEFPAFEEGTLRALTHQLVERELSNRQLH